MGGSGEPDVRPAATPPTRRRAAISLLAGAYLLPGLARARTLLPPPAQALPRPDVPPPEGAASETLKTGQDLSERMTTQVYINGQGPYNFMVDTGANSSGISTELAAALKLEAGQPTRVHGIAAAVMVDTVQIKELRLGAVRLSVKNAPVFKREDLGVDGLIGLDLLHDRVVTLNFLKNQIEITRRNYLPGSWMTVTGPAFIGSVVPARQRFGQLTIVDAEAGDHVRMTCFLDTGAEQSVGNDALRLAVQARQPPDQIVNADVLIHSVTGQSLPGKVALVPHMRIGGVEFSSFGLAFADLHTFDIWQLQNQPALLVGMDLLRLFDAVIIDFAERQVTFQKH
jgi:predicted aspartyl protease